MNWQDIAEWVWRIRPWTAWALLAIYLVPICRLCGFFLQCGARPFMFLNKPLGIWENLVCPFRDYPVSAWLAGGSLWHFWQGIEHGDYRAFAVSVLSLALILAGYGMRRFRRSSRLRLLEFIRLFPAIHPQEFFDHLICFSGFVRHALPEKPFKSVDPSNLDFRRGRLLGRKIGLLRIFVGVWSTIQLARLVLLAKEEGGAEFLRTAASALSVVWGTRICQLVRGAFTVEGKERLLRPGGADIFLFTHMSFIDFSLVPLLLSARPVEGDVAAANHLPSFLIAKDHFRDNVLFYRIMGIGRAAEAMGMTFVERGGRGGAEGAMEVEAKALECLLEKGCPLAIFPQGTRAVGLRGPRGERLDGAYYTVGSRDRIRADGAHLKKGAAHIAAAAAEWVDSAGAKIPVRIFPVAVSGTAISCPRGSARIFADVHMRLRVGEVITVEAKSHSTVGHLHSRIDFALKSAGKVHAELERRFFEDMRGLVEPREIEEVAIAMKTWRGDDYLVHAILDAIYACPQKLWRPFIGELVHSMLNFDSREDLLQMKGRVADAVAM